MFREDTISPQPREKEGFVIDFSKKRKVIGIVDIGEAVEETNKTTGIEQQIAHEKVVSLSLAYLGKWGLSTPRNSVESTANNFNHSFASLPTHIRVNYLEQFLRAWDNSFSDYPYYSSFSGSHRVEPTNYSVREFLVASIPVWNETLSGGGETTFNQEAGFNYFRDKTQLDEESAGFLSLQPVDLPLVLTLAEWKDKARLGQRIKQIKEASQLKERENITIPYRLLSQELTDEMFEGLMGDLSKSPDKNLALLSIDNYLRLKREILIQLYEEDEGKLLKEEREFFKTNFEQNQQRVAELVNRIPLCMILNSDYLDNFILHGIQSSAATSQRLGSTRPMSYYDFEERKVFPSAAQYVYASFGKFDPAYLAHVRLAYEARVNLKERDAQQQAFPVFAFVDPAIMDKPDTFVTKDEVIELQTASFFAIRPVDEETKELFRNALAKRKFSSQILTGKHFKELKTIELAQKHPYNPKVEFVHQYERRRPYVGDNMQKDWYAEEVKIKDGVDPSTFIVFIAGNPEERDALIAKGIPQDKIVLKDDFIQDYKDREPNFTQEDIVRLEQGSGSWFIANQKERAVGIDKRATEIKYYARIMGIDLNELWRRYNSYVHFRGSEGQDVSGLAPLAAAGINYIEAHQE